MSATFMSATFYATWTIRVRHDPGSVPDRPMPYSSTGAYYRPDWTELKFSTGASGGNDPGALKLSALTLADGTARGKIRLDSATIYGPRLKKNGEPGANITSESFYRSGLDRAPAWLSELVAATLAQLT